MAKKRGNTNNKPPILDFGVGSTNKKQKKILPRLDSRIIQENSKGFKINIEKKLKYKKINKNNLNNKNENRHKSLKILFSYIFAIIAFSASFVFRNTYVYVGSGIIILFVIIFSIFNIPKKTKKQKKPEIKKEKKEKLIKKEVKEKKESKKLKRDKGKSQFLKIFLISIVSIIAIIAPFILRNIYVYVGSGIIILSILLLIFIKIPKKKKKEEPEEEKKIIKEVTPTYTTEFDKFYNYIKKRKKITVSEIAKVFGISKKRAEDWSNILEHRGLIKIDYSIFGEPKLRCLN